MATKKQRSRKGSERTVEVVQGGRLRTLRVEVNAQVEAPALALELDDIDEDDDDVPSAVATEPLSQIANSIPTPPDEGDDEDDDDLEQVRQFQAAPEDELDLRWYFDLGKKARPQGLSPAKAKRWSRIHRCLDGGGRALCLHYTNPFGVEAALAPAVAEPRRYFPRRPDLSTPQACVAMLQRLAMGSGATRHHVHYLASRDAADWRAVELARELVLRDLELDYSLFLARKANPRAQPTDAAVFDLDQTLRRLAPLCGGARMTEELLVQRGFDLATWGGLRIDARHAQALLEGRLTVPIDGALIALRAFLARPTLLLPEEFSEYDDEGEELPAPSRGYELFDLEFGNMDRFERKWAKENIDPACGNRRENFDIVRELARDHDEFGEEFRLERGTFDRNTKRFENDPRNQLGSPGQHWTSVSEIADAAYGRAAARGEVDRVRQLLVALACPGAKTPNARLPIAWFSTGPGVEFYRQLAGVDTQANVPSGVRHRED